MNCHFEGTTAPDSLYLNCEHRQDLLNASQSIQNIFWLFRISLSFRSNFAVFLRALKKLIKVKLSILVHKMLPAVFHFDIEKFYFVVCQFSVKLKQCSKHFLRKHKRFDMKIKMREKWTNSSFDHFL